MTEPTPPATESLALAEPDGEPLLDLLAELIERSAYLEARETVATLLGREPADPDLLAARAFLDEELARTGTYAAALCFRGPRSFVNRVDLSVDGGRDPSDRGATLDRGRLTD